MLQKFLTCKIVTVNLPLFLNDQSRLKLRISRYILQWISQELVKIILLLKKPKLRFDQVLVDQLQSTTLISHIGNELGARSEGRIQMLEVKLVFSVYLIVIPGYMKYMYLRYMYLECVYLKYMY